MPFTTAPFPAHDPIVTPKTGIATKPLIDWVTALTGDVDAAPSRLRSVTVTGQSAAIGTTAIPTGALAAGLYRVSWYARITTAASVSSSLTITIGWTESGNVLSKPGTALTGNTTGTLESGGLPLIRIDASTPVTYATAYASTGGTAMQYRLDVVLEQIEA